MVRSQEDLKIVVYKRIEERQNVCLFGPLTDLIVHTSGAQFHPMHDLVNLVNDEPGDSHFWVRKQLINLGRILIS